MRFLPANRDAVLVELETLEDTLALFSSLRESVPAGVIQMVPAARTVLIRFRQDETTARDVVMDVCHRGLDGPAALSSDVVEIPTVYDGEDLAEVAKLTGLTVEEVVQRHLGSEYTVAFCGFTPGFAYLLGGDPSLKVPRRSSPRTRIPAGSVALAGAFSGVYPQSSPGGWQLIGRTSLAMWDIRRTPSALLQLGSKVRFVQSHKRQEIPARAIAEKESGANARAGGGQFLVRAAPLPVLFQDHGRSAQSGQGVSASGAADRSSFDQANRIVGNPYNTPCLEITAGGFVFEATASSVIGVAGALCAISIETASGAKLMAAVSQPVSIEAGDVVSIGRPVSGLRNYLAVRGGFEVASVLGSAATDTLSKIGPEPVVSGTRLPLKAWHGPLNAVSLSEQEPPAPRSRSEIITLDVFLGPRTDWFTPCGLRALIDQEWTVTAESNRVGLRLAGESSIERRLTGELPSEGTVRGAIQVPHNGKPVVFLADHPLTGGYPVIGAVADYQLDLAGQVPVGARLRFRVVNEFAEIASI